MSGHVTSLPRYEFLRITVYCIRLRILKAHGMRQDCLHEVFRSTVMAKLVYARPA